MQSSPENSPKALKDAVRDKWQSKQGEFNQSQDLTKADEDRQFAEAKKRINHVVNWELNDDKHLKLDQIQTTVIALKQIMNNVREHPEDGKFRRIRIANKTFGRNVRDAPGGEDYMIACGWKAAVVNMERYFVFDGQPGDSLTWKIFEEGCKELDKLGALIDGKLNRSKEDKKAELELRREQARLAIEDDKQARKVKFTYA